MAGQYNNQAEEKFQETKGECVQYVKLQSGNHYAITDWNPDTAPHQARRTPPAPASSLMCFVHAESALLMHMFTSSSLPHHTSIGQGKLDLCTLYDLFFMAAVTFF